LGYGTGVGPADDEPRDTTARPRSSERGDPDAAADVHADAPEVPPRRERDYRGTGIVPAVVVGLLLALALVFFIAQNSDPIQLEWLWLDFELSPAALVLGALVIAVAADEVFGLLWRRRRRHRLVERDRLAALPRDTGTAT
jgi:uncharacterized integral membrane protein